MPGHARVPSFVTLDDPLDALCLLRLARGSVGRPGLQRAPLLRGWYPARIIGNVGSYTVAYLSDTGAPAETERDVKRYRIRDPIGNCFIKPP